MHVTLANECILNEKPNRRETLPGLATGYGAARVLSQTFPSADIDGRPPKRKSIYDEGRLSTWFKLWNKKTKGSGKEFAFLSSPAEQTIEVS